MFNKLPKRTGVYQIRDNIEFFELKIHFRHINSLLKLPRFDYNKNNELVHRNKGYGLQSLEDEVKIVKIKWQEKLLSASEVELYKEEKNCITEIQKKYHKWLLEKSETDEDLNKKTSNSKRRRKKRNKKQLQNESEFDLQQKIKTHQIHTYVDEDNFQPDDEKSHPDLGNSIQMFIYAAIDIDTQLVQLQWFEKVRLLHIYPDFNSFTHKPYFIEIDKDYRHLYAYAVENISQARPISSFANLNLYLQLPELRPHWCTEEERSTAFRMPPKRTKRFSLLLELREASNFEYENIHVRYHIRLPRKTIHEEGLLDASTHSSSKSGGNSGISGIHHFGYNWQLTLLCEEDFNAADLLHIYFEIISIDSWERERVEGYAHVAMNLHNPAKVEIYHLQCLRPVDKFWEKLERFFIGGRRKFDYVKFFGQKKNENDDGEEEFHCLYGRCMQSTGTLTMSLQSFTQRNCELLEPCPPSGRGGMTLDDIMLAYREARERLEAISLK